MGECALWHCLKHATLINGSLAEEKELCGGRKSCSKTLVGDEGTDGAGIISKWE